MRTRPAYAGFTWQTVLIVAGLIAAILAMIGVWNPVFLAALAAALIAVALLF
jgi:hypothetical protein